MIYSAQISLLMMQIHESMHKSCAAKTHVAQNMTIFVRKRKSMHSQYADLLTGAQMYCILVQNNPICS